jgi:hypothetical protein
MAVTGLDGGVRDRSPQPRLPVVGLLRALERYDTTLDTPFWAYLLVGPPGHAGELGVSAERVRQLEQRALEKLRTAVEEAADRHFCT